MDLILFGFKGCGKTHFGKLLSESLKVPFVDLDALILQSSKMTTIPELYEHLGEEGFRTLEKKILLGLEKTPRKILSLGGGAVLDPENVAHLQKIGTLVYLDAPFELIEARIKKEPAFAKKNSLKEHYLKRKPLYEQIPAIRLDLKSLKTDEVLTKLKTIWIHHGL